MSLNIIQMVEDFKAAGGVSVAHDPYAGVIILGRPGHANAVRLYRLNDQEDLALLAHLWRRAQDHLSVRHVFE
jgi:hypothetical protein